MAQAEGDRLLQHMTREAVDAAIHGMWDKVAEIYDRRASSGLLEGASAEIVKKIIQDDQWVMTRIREVQALTQQNLEVAQNHRRHLETLKRQWVGRGTSQAFHRVSI